jgi:probable HAF family extracellular repeat protein
MRKSLFVLGVATLLLFAVENAGAVPYVVTDMGTLGTGTASYAYGVNNSGQVVGYSTITTGVYHAFVYSGGTLTDISASWSTPNARAYAINDSGTVVGYIATSPLHGFIYNAGTMTDVSTLPGEVNGATSRAFAVTSTGIIAGGGGANGQGWVYDGTTSYAVGKLSSSANNGTIFGVNNSQWAVGASMQGGIDPTTYPIYSYYNGTSWVASMVMASGGQATFINSSKTIVGSTYPGAVYGGTGTNAWVATYSGGGYTATYLPTLGGTYGHAAFAISDTGVAVGTSQDVSAVNRAFVAKYSGTYSGGTYSGGTWTTTDLNTLIAAGTGWTLTRATAISTNGAYICGYGTIAGQTHGFLLAPLLGDANLDGTVNINDLSKVLTNYDQTGMGWADGDFNADGKVNIDDLSKVLTNYDQSVGSSAAGIKAVPEPSSLLLFGVVAIGLLTYAWRRCRV